jgi:hypothetical protein
VQTPVEIRYEGTVIGRANQTSGSIDDGGTMFLDTEEPMPVGTKLELHAGGGQVAQVRVVRVSEASETVAAGMIVRSLGASEPIDIPMPPLIPPRPVVATPPPPARAGTVRGMGTVPPVARPPAAAPPPGPPQAAVKGEISTPAPAPAAVKGEIHTPAPAPPPRPAEAVPEPVAAEGSTNGSSELAEPMEISGVIESGGSTAELPAIGNGANRRRRSRRRR